MTTATATRVCPIESALALVATDAVSAKHQLTELCQQTHLTARQLTQARMTLAFLYSRELDYSASLLLVKQVLKDEPANIQAQFNAAYLEQQLGDNHNAVTHYARLFELTRHRHTRAKLLQGMALHALGQLDTASDAYQQHLKQHPNDIKACFLLAQLAKESNDEKTYRHYLQPVQLAYHKNPAALTALIHLLTTYDNPAWQRLDHKGMLSDSINRYLDSHPRASGYFPVSFHLPSDELKLSQHITTLKQLGYWVIKPVSASGGQGIELTQHPEQANLTFPAVIQRYIHNPLLLQGHKFNVRCYVVVLQPYPLKACLWHNGVVFCAPSAFNLACQDWKNAAMHIANPLRHLNNNHKGDADSRANPGSGSEVNPDNLTNSDYASTATPSPPDIMDWLTAKSILTAQGIDVDSAFDNIQALAEHVLTMSRYVDILPQRLTCQNQYAYPLKLLGFDITFDCHNQPYLLEIERFPGLSAPESDAVSNRIKQVLLSDVGRLLFDDVEQKTGRNNDSQAGEVFVPISYQ